MGILQKSYTFVLSFKFFVEFLDFFFTERSKFFLKVVLDGVGKQNRNWGNKPHACWIEPLNL